MKLTISEFDEDVFIFLTLPLAFFMNWFVETKLGERIANKLPYKPRFIHWLWSVWGGYFWLPCDICGRNYGGHEPSHTWMIDYNHGNSVCRNCKNEAEKHNKKILDNCPKYMNL